MKKRTQLIAEIPINITKMLTVAAIAYRSGTVCH